MNRKDAVVLISVLMLVTLGACVEVPSTGPTPPDYTAQVRFMYADPALPTLTVSIADGPTYTQYRDITAGAFGTQTAFQAFPAGAKRLYVKRGDGTLADRDTSVATFATETVNTLVILPRDTVALPRVLLINERSIFQIPGMRDTARVRFINALAGKDTVDVWTVRGNAAALVGADNLRFGRATSFFLVPRDSVWKFYVSRYTGSTNAVSETLTVTGTTSVQYTMVLYDSLQRARVLKLEDR